VAAASKPAAGDASASSRGRVKQPATDKAQPPAYKPTTSADATAKFYYHALQPSGATSGWTAGAEVPMVCFDCLEHVQELLRTIQSGDPELPRKWQQQCIKCLQMDPADGLIMWNGMDVRNAMAGWLGRMLFMNAGVVIGDDMRYDPRKLPRSPEPGVSAVCHSCMVNWIAEGSSMVVKKDRDKMAHCHACLRECEESTEQQQMDMAIMVEYALASRFLGKFITSPVVRKLTGASQKELGKTESCSTKGAKASSSAAAASNSAGET
jgi:hypothetical protein